MQLNSPVLFRVLFMGYLQIAIYIVSGLALGSFVGALTYRLPRGKGFVTGRSKCPRCNRTIAGYDNIPVISYLILRGKCRKCGGRISPRYFLIELTTSLAFLGIYLFWSACFLGNLSLASCYWPINLGYLYHIFFPFLFVILFSIFVIDLEERIIPDSLTFAGFSLVFLVLLLTNAPIYEHLFSAFILGLFLLLINIFTRGKGMGLGDVKFVLLPGLFFGLKLSFIFLFSAFLTGAVVGLILILVNRAKFGQKIAFGPFLVFAFFMTFLWGDKIFNLLFK